MSRRTSSMASREASSKLLPSRGSSPDSTNQVIGIQETDQSSINSGLSQTSSTSPRSQPPEPKDYEGAILQRQCGTKNPSLAAKVEFSRIRDAYPLLQGTGCTPSFCQAGRMIKTDEPRVGTDQPTSAVQEKAADFLRQLRREGIIASDEHLRNRLASVFKQIDQNCRDCKELDNPGLHHLDSEGPASGHWDLTLSELEHGVRLAWKHSQRCIMRSEYRSLQVCDLRQIRTSKAMGSSLIQHLEETFGGGDITPTVFVFPARKAGNRGPLVWNSQLLSFAGYTEEDGTITGDSANVELTSAVIDLGWEPPPLRTRWDLLPIVTMAENDGPVITEVPERLFPLVHITHPTYRLQFERLGLRWVPAPALSRLGFDIGGVQFTAAPFVGWFMDAEIGVRDLADQTRYNVLPRLVTSLGWSSSEQDLERAPEHERLALLSKAQAELNYAVFHSFATAGVKMSDTLSASSMYCNFDDEHFRDKGFRLPSNPYWLAPPQGSIVPIWHRGGSPNYQPMPLICRNRQDPVRAWKREVAKAQSQDTQTVRERASSLSVELMSCPFGPSDCRDTPADVDGQNTASAVHILYCTAASTARKLAQDLHRRLSNAIERDASRLWNVTACKALNDFSPHKVGTHDFVFIVASTAGRGEIPPNGNKFGHNMKVTTHKVPFKFSVFGNGNSAYHETYNECANTVKQHLLHYGAQALDVGFFEGDTAEEDPPWNQFDTWVRSLLSSLSLSTAATAEEPSLPHHVRTDHLEDFREAKLLSVSKNDESGIRHLVLDVGDLNYRALSHVAIIPPNDAASVRRALSHLGLSGKEMSNIEGTTARDFLKDFVDFDQPFKDLPRAMLPRLSAVKRTLVTKMTLRDALPLLSRSWCRNVLLHDLFSTMPLIAPRIFSIASCPRGPNKSDTGRLDLLVQSRPDGRMTKYLKVASPGATLKLRYIDTGMEKLLDDASRPLICFATGSGLAPVRSLLQHRMNQKISSDNAETTDSTLAVAPITLLLGFRQRDTPIIESAIRAPLAAGIVDILLLTPSNPDKMRAQDRIFEPAVRDCIEVKLKAQGASVYVCAGTTAAEEFAVNLGALVGCDIQAALGSRYVQEVFKPAC